MTQNWVDIGFAALQIDASGNRFELAEPFAQIRQFDPAGDGGGAILLMAAQSVNLGALQVDPFAKGGKPHQRSQSEAGKSGDGLDQGRNIGHLWSPFSAAFQSHGRVRRRCVCPSPAAPEPQSVLSIL